ncbi:MAG: patatin-like phospholipase family protein [Salibacteraceae bacterium]
MRAWVTHTTTILISVLLPLFMSSQTVGLVFSGGGSSGMAHIGVLKALEENSIPIDYITGTSIGALVGGMYAAGYSPEQIELLLTSDRFRKIALGEIEDEYIYYFRKPIPNASWINIKFSSLSSFLETSIPTSFINPAALDLELMHFLDGASAASNYNFDSLMIPFRCIASDIEDKESVIFSKGNLNVAVRASMTYPAYLKPIRINGKLLYDGGLYNNFPTDVMRDAFKPDIIIGSNVSSNEDPPREDDFLSQLRNMVISKTNYELNGDSTILIEPQVDYGTFNFNHLKENIDSGYTATMLKMEEIKQKVHRRVHSKLVNEKRTDFNNLKVPFEFTTVEYDGLTKPQSRYVNQIIKPKTEKSLSFESLSKGYYRVYENEKIARIFPYSKFNKVDSTYKLTLQVKKEKDLQLEFGGNVSSRPINTGYIGIGYNTINNTGMSFKANAYFGKLYASVLAKARIDIPIRLPIYIEPVVTINRWNYFNSRATFFEDNNSLFLIQNEQYAKLNTSFALNNRTKTSISGGLISLRDDYYQSQTFGQDDITDKTLFFGSTLSASLEESSLNDKLYPNEGSSFNLSIRYTSGTETYTPGSTSPEQNTLRNEHEWIDAKIGYDVYYKSRGIVRLGFQAEAVYSDQELFSNYTSSSLRSPAFQPTPESKTLFLESFRAYQYAAIGHKFIFNIVKGVDLRLEGYVFQPYRFAVSKSEEKLEPINRRSLERRYTIATANAVYRSPLGPISFALNYYFNVPEISSDNLGEQRLPVTFIFHFGYIIFNERALK